jgi:hypothetical protein
MRLVLALAMAGMLQVCGSKDDPSSQSTSTASAEPAATAAISVQAQIGGQLVAVGDHQVELKLYKSGFAEALVLDARGETIASPAEAKLGLRAGAEADAKQEIALDWQPPMARFAASGDARAELVPGPVEVELSLAEGKSARGTLEAAVLLVGPELGGTLVVAGQHGIEVVADVDGSVEAVVHDAAGARVEGDAEAKLELELTGVDGKLRAVALGWNAARARFTGRVDAGVQLAAGPARIGVAGKASVKLPKLALRAKAKHGGRLVVAGDYSIELVAQPGGFVAAYVFDASGKAYAKADLDLSLKLGAGAFVKLVWDAPSLSYRAKFDADLSVAPIVIALEAHGKPHVGASAKLGAKLHAKLAAPDVKAKAAAKAKAGADAKASAKVTAPSVKVSAPKVGVSVNKSASASAGTGAKAGAGFSVGSK